MTRVLILSASYGSGHNAAARSLAAGFERAQATVTVVDHFAELVHPVFDRAGGAGEPGSVGTGAGRAGDGGLAGLARPTARRHPRASLDAPAAPGASGRRA